MTRLPISGADDGTWGDVLNDFLLQAHTAQGVLKDGSVGSTQLAANAVTASSIATSSITEALLDSAVVTKLNNVAPVTSVNGHVGVVTLTKSDVGLSAVDNTSDVNKPISTATQTALDAKADSTDVGAKLLLIDDVESLPVGTPAGVVVVVKS